MKKTTRHKMLKVMKENGIEEDFSISQISKMCLKENPGLMYDSLPSKVRILRKEGLVYGNKTGPSGFILKISRKGLNVLESYEDMYNGKRDSGPLSNYNTEYFGTSFYLKGIENYAYNVKRWFRSSEVASFFGVPNRNLIAIKLSQLHALGFLDKTRQDQRVMYKSKGVPKTVTPMKEIETTLEAVIERYLYNENRWIKITEITDFLKLPEGYNLYKVLSEMATNGSIYFVGNTNESLIAKSTKLFTGRIEAKGIEVVKIVMPEKTATPSDETITLEEHIEKLLSNDVSQKSIDVTCFEALKPLLQEEKSKKRKAELELLKEKDFSLLNEFEDMKIKLANIKEELEKE